VRWLLLKDLRILRRSPLLVGLLAAYPIVIAVLIGFALSRGPDKPAVAFLNQVDKSGSEISVGGEQIDTSSYADRLFESIDPVPVKSRRRTPL
jgi:ABC-2 type transport system permease protein